MQKLDNQGIRGRTFEAIACLFLFLFSFASNGSSQECTPAGKVNTDFSRVYIFVDKSDLVGHQHAVEGKLASGELFLKDPKGGKLVSDRQSFNADKMLGAVGVADELIIYGDIWVVPE